MPLNACVTFLVVAHLTLSFAGGIECFLLSGIGPGCGVKCRSEHERNAFTVSRLLLAIPSIRRTPGTDNRLVTQPPAAPVPPPTAIVRRSPQTNFPPPTSSFQPPVT